MLEKKYLFYEFVQQSIKEYIATHFKQAKVQVLKGTPTNTTFPLVIIKEKMNQEEEEYLHKVIATRKYMYDIEIYTEDMRIQGVPIEKENIRENISSIIQNWLEKHRFKIILNSELPSEEKRIARKIIRCRCLVNVETKEILKK